jgi:hypothetical protein
MNRLTRRSFLGGAAVAVVAGAGVVVWHPWSDEHETHGIAPLFGDGGGIRSLANAYRKIERRTRAAYAAALAPQGARPEAWLRDTPTSRIERHLAAVAEQDWKTDDGQSDRIVVVDGWRMSRTEMRACAVYALGV